MVAISWQNSDGLGIQLGTNEAIQRTAGEYRTHGMNRISEVIVTGSTLTSSAVIQDNNTEIPKNAYIEAVEIETTTLAVGSGATLDFGLIRTDRTTELDYNGFIAAYALSTWSAAGFRATMVTGSTGAGALIGTTLSNPGFLVVNYNTAAITAGVMRLRVYWRGT